MQQFDELEQCIELCDPYMSHLLKEFRKNPLDLESSQNIMRTYLDGLFVGLVTELIHPQKQGLSGPQAVLMLQKLLEAKDCAIRASRP